MDPKAVRESMVAQGTSFKGIVTSDCPVTVSGTVDGELSAPALVVTDSGSVNGKVKVEDLKSGGEIAGQIEAGAMQLSGKVRDNTSIRAKTLEVKLASSGSEKLQVVFGPSTWAAPANFTIVELARKVIALTGSRSEIVNRPLRADDPLQRQPDLTLARKALDWEPTTPLDEGLKRTIAYFEARFSGG